jgi:hypothetical protein
LQLVVQKYSGKFISIHAKAIRSGSGEERDSHKKILNHVLPGRNRERRN